MSSSAVFFPVTVFKCVPFLFMAAFDISIGYSRCNKEDKQPGVCHVLWALAKHFCSGAASGHNAGSP